MVWPLSQLFIFFVTYESAQLARPLHNTKLEKLACDKHSNLLCVFISYEKIKCYEYGPCGRIHTTLFSL